ncbi:outer membrane insertion signal domain protein [Proteus penneri ATCC 35198]|nr:outer membrane insertion signal domain protein [Proteus penneri ATCC 35198]
MYNVTDSINLNANIVKEKTKGDKADSSNTNYTFGVGYRW